MTDYERRPNFRGGFNRKRRHRDDDENDRRPQRRRYEEPAHVRLRKQLLGIAESPLKKPEDEISDISTAIIEGYEDDLLRKSFVEVLLQLTTEQPLKIPFLASLLLILNVQKPDLVGAVLNAAQVVIKQHIKIGAWREVKLVLRLFSCLQGLLEGDGVFPILEELFSRAVDLQTASTEDGLGLEFVNIILLTIAYLMASSATGFEERAAALLEKTDIIASTPHILETLVDPYPGTQEGSTHEPISMLGILQRQLQAEAANSWPIKCIPRPWKSVALSVAPEAISKHILPKITIPSHVVSGKRARLPEVYLNVYSDQEIQTVPPETDITFSIVHDALVDTINILDYNRNVTAKFLIDIDSYFAPDTFVKRATPFDKLREVEDGKSTWKPEDIAVDAVFSQLFQLPAPEHKLVYYHSVLTEACKIAPAAIAPSLGRAIRYLYKNLDTMDLELQYRFTDWFSHHLSNFGFTWKWIEWIDDVELPIEYPKKSFIVGALEKEIRLSFAMRIRKTLPEPYQALLSEAKDKDVPDFKYADDATPYAQQAREILRLLRAKASDSEVQEQIDLIHEAATEQGVMEPLVPSTDAYVTSVCLMGAKSLSHVLSCIDRYMERLSSIGAASEVARRQIITSVMDYWAEKPGIGVNIVDKLLNYTILTPMSVIEWALVDKLERGEILAQAHIYEMIASTVFKVTNRVRQIVTARNQKSLAAEQVALLDETLAKEKEQMKSLFMVLEDALRGVADGSADAILESRDQDEEPQALLRGWGRKWLRVFRRKLAVEEAWIQETLASADLMYGNGEDEDEDAANGMENGNEDGTAHADVVDQEEVV